MTQILLGIASAHIRLALRIYFNIAFPLLAIIGDQCCHKQSQLRLFRNRALEVTQTTGWLRGTSAAYAMYTLRRSPADFLGVIMILAGVLWLAADLVVSALVVPINVVDRCAFNTTGDYGAMPNSNLKMGRYTPSDVGGPWDLAKGALDVSRANGGLTGIFPKVNTDPMFRADVHDIVGQWECKTAGQDVMYPSRQNQTLMVEDLFRRELIYEWAEGGAMDFIGLNWYTQFFVWSSSISDWSYILAGLTPDEFIQSEKLELWDVRAAVDISLNASDTKVIRPYHCTINTHMLDWVIGKLEAYSTIQEFTEQARAAIYRYFDDNIPLTIDPGVAIASVLDIIVMLGGMRFSRQHPESTASYVRDPMQGCFATKTLIPAPVLLVWILVTAITLGVSAYWLYLIVINRQLQAREPAFAALVSNSTPNGLLSWIKQAIRQTDNEDRPSDYSDHKNWLLTPRTDIQGLQLTRKTNIPASGQRPRSVKSGGFSGRHHYQPVREESYGYGYLPASWHIPRKPVADIQVTTSIPRKPVANTHVAGFDYKSSGEAIVGRP